MNKKILIIILISIAFFFTYLPHLDYKLPLHVDEWNAIHSAQELKEGTYNDTLGALRIGFYVFLTLIPFNLVDIYHVFPAIWAAISAVVLLFVFKEKIGFKWAYVASLFFIFIKSNIATLGHWFFTPLTFSIPFLLWLHYAYSKLIKKPSNYQLLHTSIPAIILLFTYPIAPIFYFITQFFTFAWIKVFQDKHLRRSLIYIITGLTALSTALLFITLNENPFKVILEYGLISISWFNVAQITSPLHILTWIGFISAIIGVFVCIIFKEKREKYASELAWLSVGLVWIGIAHIAKYSYLVPLERVVFFTAIITCVFSAIGLKYSTRLIQEKCNRKLQYTILLLCIIMILVLLKPLYYDFVLTPQGKEIYYAISEEEYTFIKSIQWQQNQTVLAPVYTSVAIKAITDADTVIHPPFVRDMKEMELIRYFYQPLPCKHSENIFSQITEKSMVTHIYSPKELNCLQNKTKLIAQEDSSYLYKIT